MPRIRAIAESAPTSNPRRVATFNPRHPASKLYTSPDGGSVRLTWSPVNQTWFLLWPGDAPVERQQVLGQFQQWEEGDREARRITAGGPNPADAPEERERRRTMGRENPHGDPLGTSLRGFHVILRGGRPSVRVMATSKYDAEQQVRAWGAPELYPIWYILSDEEVAQQNIGQNVVENPVGPKFWVVYARVIIEKEAMPHATWRDPYTPRLKDVRVARAGVWRKGVPESGLTAEVAKAKAGLEDPAYHVFVYPANERDPIGRAKSDVLKAAG